jgi:MYXO-CTERM domain-containing protein
MRLLKMEMRFGLLMSALALASASSASAQETCTTSDDCDHGYECISNSACPDIACAPGEACEPLPCTATSACTPKSDCAADADCAAGWKCATATYEQCDGGGAQEQLPACDPADPDCVKQDPPQDPEPTEPPNCEPVTDSFCAPPWALPCETATDCGPGFECTELVSRCSSGGSAGSAGSGGGSDPSPGEDEGAPLPPENLIAPPECVDELSGVFACVLIETPCTADADCGAGLTCQEGPNTAVCGGATPTPADSGNGSGGAAGSGDGDLPADSDADRAAPIDCTTPEPTYACAPPDYYTGYDTIGRDGEAASGSGDIDNGGNTSGGGLVNPLDPGGDDEDGEEPPVFGSPGAGEPNPEAESADTMESSGGCSATGADADASSSALLMLLAVLGLAKRRRQHA